MPKRRRALPSLEVLQSLFSYDKDSGEITRLDGRSNGRLFKKVRGYKTVGIDRQPFLAHRVIWKLMTGQDPTLIDHIDGNSHNNAWDNLRICDDAQNLWNRAAPKHNKSGVKGVWFDSLTKRWRAEIKVRGKVTRLGRFDTLEEAAQARAAASDKLHGEFARAA